MPFADAAREAAYQVELREQFRERAAYEAAKSDEAARRGDRGPGE
jgi:hypothetical protein